MQYQKTCKINYTEHSNRTDCYTNQRPEREFVPIAPVRLSTRLNTESSTSSSDSSDFETTKGFSSRLQCKSTTRFRLTAQFPSLGFFWDIENCPVPKHKSALAIVSKLRSTFLHNYREVDFVVVCDVKKERLKLIHELNDAQVNVIHVEATSKNAADEKLRQSLRRFAELHSPPACIVLISSDINFAADLSDFRYRERIHVILVHNDSTNQALIMFANECYSYRQLIDDIPTKLAANEEICDYVYLAITNVPCVNLLAVKNRLERLSDNCGGKVVEIDAENGVAYMRFLSQMTADRAKLRIHGEDVYGHKIQVVTQSVRNYAGRKVKLPEVQHESNSNPNGFAVDLRRQQNALVAANLTGLRSQRAPDSAIQRVHRTSSSSDYSEDSTDNNIPLSSSVASLPIHLMITNLDSTLRFSKIRKLITIMLKDYVKNVTIHFSVQSDGASVANVRVGSQQEGKFVVSLLHRQKLGNKRVLVSYATNSTPQPEQLKSLVVAMLKEAAPEKKMPLYTFIELLERRYKYTISVSEINKLKDVCKVTDEGGARVIQLTEDVSASPSPNLCQTLVPFCTRHCSASWQNRSWYELCAAELPCLNIPLKIFAIKLGVMLNKHQSCLPLLSFQVCYEYEFQENLPLDRNGVPLEHLITCIPNVQIKISGPTKNIKFIVYDAKAVVCSEDTVMKSVPFALLPKINLFCRELVDLMKTSEHCQIMLTKFIPAYYHHFGRQCHVADYGFTKLLDLLESIPHVVQILGDGSQRVITLCHQAQMRRFTLDLLRVVKIQPYKEISEDEYATAYETVLNRPFSSIEYGLCSFGDLLDELPENTINIRLMDGNVKMIELPKRQQTVEEMVRTKKFAEELIDMLKHAPYCTMLFNKFVPAYHHHFGYQCKVSNYGFNKLIELFESIPEVVVIEKLPVGERTIRLTLPEGLKVLGQQLQELVLSTKRKCIPVDELPHMFLQKYGYPLKTEAYECKTIPDLIDALKDYIKVVQSPYGLVISNANNDPRQIAIVRTWILLMNPPHQSATDAFLNEYKRRYNTIITIQKLQQLDLVVSLQTVNGKHSVVLTDLYILAAELYWMLFGNCGEIAYSELEAIYSQYYGKALNLRQYNILSMDDLCEKFSFLLYPCGYYKKNTLILNFSLTEYQVPLPSNAFIRNNRPINLYWPPPLQQVQNYMKKRPKPPKPDTPPTPLSPNSTPLLSWNNSIDENVNLCIDIPIAQDYSLFLNSFGLMSPKTGSFPQVKNFWNPAPEPSAIPLPDKLMRTVIFNDSSDSGVNSKLDISPLESGY